jgi:peptidoglycan/xylan/chitin deacetylase (PgdA/CDA1 family)
VIVLLAVGGVIGAGIAAASLFKPLLATNPGPAAAVPPQPVHQRWARTVVSLTFDDAYEDQWLYGVPLLRSHHMTATLYVITADSDGPYPCCMSWAQLRILQDEGDDIGSHTIDHPNVTKLSPARVRQEICGSRQDMLRNGIYDPESFAYPYGSFDPAAERIVAQCGFTNARQGGGISNSSTKPESPWAETLPPKHASAVSTIAPNGSAPISLAALERFVTAAAAHGGGWLPITFHDVCDAYADDFARCMTSYGPILDSVLRQFLDWLQHAGHPGGAPQGVLVQTMRTAMNTWKRPDTTPPSAFALCDGSLCQAVPYTGQVRLTLAATDAGGTGVARIYYTLNGSAPSTSSPVYQVPLTVGHRETIKFFAVDNGGNSEHVKTVTVNVG